MDKTLHVSGFLYNRKTNQILLVKTSPESDEKIIWSMIGEDISENEDVLESFAQVVNKLLNITLKTKNIFPIYDYFHEVMQKTNHVFYVEVAKNFTFEPPKEITVSWVTFDETAKFSFHPHVKQDVIVGKRVIDAQVRDIEADDEAKEQAFIQSSLG